MIPLRIVLASLACLYPFSLAQEPKSDPDKTLIIISTSDKIGRASCRERVFRAV